MHKSGAQKRKDKRAREENAMQGRTTLFEMGITSTLEHSPSTISSEALNQIGVSTEISLIAEILDDDSNESEILPESNRQSIVRETNSVEDDYVIEGVQKKLSTDNTLFDIGLDIGMITILSNTIIDEYVLQGHLPLPHKLPVDSQNQAFPISVFNYKKFNGEVAERDWLVWSRIKRALFCFPCRMFSKGSEVNASLLSTSLGWPATAKWRKLCDRVPVHERSIYHKRNYLSWRELEQRLRSNRCMENILSAEIETEEAKWYNILQRLIDIILFLGERGLAFRGSSHLIGSVQNGNFLGLVELLSHWDPVLNEHVKKVEECQQRGEGLQVHYLSSDSQNELISLCSGLVLKNILLERSNARYYSIMVDSTPDCSHVEQTTFIIRYLLLSHDQFEIAERFLTFVDCSEKTGFEIANLILKTLEENEISLSECRGQGYDNAANMVGKYKGAQSYIISKNSLAILSPCGCHTLNLCGTDSAECCPEAITLFGTIQLIYTIFSSSPKRWEILLKHCHNQSLHSQSGTRWSERINSVKPFAANLNGIKQALENILDFNLTPKTRSEVNGAIKYVSSFECILMSSIWFKTLAPIDTCNKVIQGRDATIEVEVNNIGVLIENLHKLRLEFKAILIEAKHVASSLGIEMKLRRKRKRKHFEGMINEEGTLDEFEQGEYTEEEANFQKFVYNVIIDHVISGLTRRFNTANEILQTFGFLWLYFGLSEEEICQRSNILANIYKDDINAEELGREIVDLKSMIQIANFGKEQMNPYELINAIHKYKLENILPNISVALRIFLTIPVTVASAERSFSKLKLVKNYLRCTMLQDRMVSLARLSIECELARKIDFSNVIKIFAHQKARKAMLKQ